MKSSHTSSLAHTTWECKYHIVFAPKFRRPNSKYRRCILILDMMYKCVVLWKQRYIS